MASPQIDGYLRGRDGNDRFGVETAQAYRTEDADTPWAILHEARQLYVPPDAEMKTFAAHMIRFFDPPNGKPKFQRITQHCNIHWTHAAIEGSGWVTVAPPKSSCPLSRRARC